PSHLPLPSSSAHPASSLPSSTAGGRRGWTTTPTVWIRLTGAPPRGSPDPSGSRGRSGEGGALGQGGLEGGLGRGGGAGAEVEEQLQVAGRAGQGRRADPGHAQAQSGGGVGDRADGGGPGGRVAAHPAPADGLPPGLELRLDQQQEVAVGAGQPGPGRWGQARGGGRE